MTPSYATGSPLNQPVTTGHAHPESAAIVEQLVKSGIDSRCSFLAGYNAHTYNHPVYTASVTDPFYKAELSSPGGTDSHFGGREFRVPTGALPEGGSDHHMAIIQPDGTEVDLYCVEKIEPGKPGLIVAHNAGIPDENGLYGHCTAGGYGLQFGSITAAELESGEPLEQALFMVVPETNGTHVYPADGNAGGSTLHAPACGQWLYLEYSDPEIEALKAEKWQKEIIRRMARYGIFVGDTGGDFVKGQSGAPYAAFGGTDPMVAFAKSIGVAEGTGEYKGTYRLKFSGIVDWSHLRALKPPLPSNVVGTASPGVSNVSTVTLTTSVPVAAEETVVAMLLTSGSQPVKAISGTNGLTWQKDAEVASSSPFFGSVSIWSARASSGVVEGKTIVFELSASQNSGKAAAAISLADLAETGWADRTQTHKGTGIAWESGETEERSQAKEVAISAAITRTPKGGASSTTNVPAVELLDFLSGNYPATVAYESYGEKGKAKITGEWSESFEYTSAIVTYKHN
jgi:hypothetical protein